MRPKKLRVSNVKIAFHVHATEDESRVIKALRNCLPPGARVSLRREVYVGYYGNPIIRYEGFVGDNKDATKIFYHIIRSLRGPRYPTWIEERFDEKQQSLYIRVDKQRAYLGELVLGDEDIIHFVFKFPGYIKMKAHELEEIVEEMLSGSE